MSSIISELLAELSTFPGREEELRLVYRWHTWKPMFYRPHLFSHGKKVALLIEHVSPILKDTLGSNFDIKRAIALALVHDDPEILTGDYQAGDKAKMTPAQLAAIDAQEREAIAKLVERFPKTFAGFEYQDLQDDVQDLRTQEARVAKFMDVLDGFGEGIHELYAGNARFTSSMVNEFGTIPLFDDLNIRRRAQMLEKYPEIGALKDSHVFFEISPALDWKSILPTCSVHTKESLSKSVGYPQYDEWKKVILNSGDSEEIENLYTQREFA
ncbi:HD domain-containing protein [Acetobacteraceae bacterium]|nr:HD domain-containing protein [Candidatus Parcubacteria bacterium]